MILVEGETDFATLDYANYPVLAGPGAQNFRPEWAKQLEGIERIYAWCEPDTGGTAFIQRLLGMFPNLLVINPWVGIKDANDLAQQAGSGFSDMMDELIDLAEPPALAHSDREIRTSFITQPDMIGNNFGFVLSNYMETKKQMYISAVRQG